MSEYYHVSTDFLLGLTTESDPRKDWIEPVDPSVLPALHETPVYVPGKGWAFVDAVEKCLHFADGSVMQNEAVKEGLDTYWLSKPLRTGVGTKHALSFEMGEQNLTGIVDVSYTKVNGVMKGSYRETIAGDVNLAYRLNNKFLFVDSKSLLYRFIPNITINNFIS